MTHTVHMDPVSVMADALRRAGSMMTSDSRDWGKDRSDVWLYGLLVGWECEERHEHDDECGGDGALLEVAARHGWDADDVARLRRYRAAIAAVTSRPGGIITVDKQLTEAEFVELRTKWLAATANWHGEHHRLTWGTASGQDWTIASGTSAAFEQPAPRRRWWQRRNR